ncbi:MAG: non-canonical purine NTP pyrophosphatase [Thermoplasmata archaeon]
MLRERGLRVEQLKVHYPEVQADTLREVVVSALDWLSPRYGDDLLVDDSGLFISSLRGFPGVYSSYVYRTIGCGGILKLVRGSEDREAVFEARFGLLSGGKTLVFEGRCPGIISEEERGRGGFGFDPVFIPEGHSKTFAEMSLAEKNALSHRGRAVEELVRYLKEGGQA